MICNTNSTEFSNGHMHGNFPSHFQSAQYSTSATAILSINIVFLNETISRSDVVRDLGNIVDPNLKFVDYIRGIVSRAHLSASHIIRCFFSRTLQLMSRAFTTVNFQINK